MTSKIKALSLAFGVTVALGAVIASAAQAGGLDIEASPAVITGHSEAKSNPEFTVQSTDGKTQAQVKCDTATLEGTTAQKSALTDLTLTPTFGGCKVIGLAAAIRMNGCKYTLTGAGQIAGTFQVDIAGCTIGKQIEVEKGGCAYKIGEQTSLSHVIAKPLNAHEVTLEAKITGIVVQQVAGGFFCPDGFSGHTGPSGTLTANTVIKAFQFSKSQQVVRHSHEYSETLCGTQVNILLT